MKTEMELQQENVKHLLQLIQENPDLKIIPMVDTDIVGGDDFQYWAGNWSKARIDEYWVDGERICFKSCDKENLEDRFFNNFANDNAMEGKSMEELEKLAKDYVDNLDWEKVIVVYIVTP